MIIYQVRIHYLRMFIAVNQASWLAWENSRYFSESVPSPIQYKMLTFNVDSSNEKPLAMHSFPCEMAWQDPNSFMQCSGRLGHVPECTHTFMCVEMY